MGYRANLLWRIELDMPYPCWMDGVADVVSNKVRAFAEQLTAEHPLVVTTSHTDSIQLCEKPGGHFDAEHLAIELRLSEEDQYLLMGDKWPVGEVFCSDALLPKADWLPSKPLKFAF